MIFKQFNKKNSLAPYQARGGGAKMGAPRFVLT